MPKKPQIEKERIIEEAFNIIRTEPIENLTARYLGSKLNTTPKPIFRCFTSMEEVKQEAINKARQVYTQYIKDGMASEVRPFRGVGRGFIKFASEEPKLFQLLFMTEGKKFDDVKSFLMAIDDSYEIIIKSVMDTFYLDSEEEALQIYRGLWTLVHGIGTLIATNVYKFHPEEIEVMLNKGVFGYVDYQELLRKDKEHNFEE